MSEYYNRRMTESLDGVTNFMKIVDDNCVYSQTMDEHVQHVCAFLQRCREKGTRLNREKFHFAQLKSNSREFFCLKMATRYTRGFMKQSKTFLLPITLLKSFYGMTNQLAPFNNKLTEIPAPIRPLLSTKTAFHIDEEKDGRRIREREKEVDIFY